MMNRLFAVCLGLALLAGCSKPAAPTAQNAAEPHAATQAVKSTDDDDANDRSGPDRDDPCQLLEVSEVEAVIGPLAGPPYRSNENNDQPMPRGGSCRYVGRDLHYIEFSVSRTGGSLLLKGMDIPGQVAHDTHMKGQLPKGLLPADTTFAGDWDDLRVMGCCRINAFLGEALIVLDYTGSRATPLQAVTLVNKALGRMDKPLTAIDGRAGIDIAKQRLAAAKNHPAACQLVTRAEAESIVNAKLTADPVAGKDECTYKYRTGSAADDTASNETVTLKVDWSYGFTHFRENSTVHSIAGGESADKAVSAMADIGKAMQGGDGDPFSNLAKAIKQQAAKAEAKPATPPADSAPAAAPASPAGQAGPWDEAVFAYPEFLAVKKDILVHVEAGLTPDLGQKFAAKAMAKL